MVIDFFDDRKKAIFLMEIRNLLTSVQVAEEGRLVYLGVTDVKMDIWKPLIYHRNKWLSNGLCTLIEYIKENEFGDSNDEM